MLNLQRSVITALHSGANDAAAMSALLHDRLDIYRNNFLQRLIRVLFLTYPACANLTGDEFFREMAAQYIQQNPPKVRLLDDYGAGFSVFIAQYPYAQQINYLAEVAHLEWCYHRVTIGLDATTFDVRQFASILDSQRANIIFHLPLNSYLISSIFPLKKIFEMARLNSIESGEVYFSKQDNYFLIWRDKLFPKIEALSSTEWHLLSAIKNKKNFGELSEQKKLQIAMLLPQFISKGWISDFTLFSPYAPRI